MYAEESFVNRSELVNRCVSVSLMWSVEQVNQLQDLQQSIVNRVCVCLRLWMCVLIVFAFYCFAHSDSLRQP